jgi:long-subunit acyl-CoA synthetase (AMP-forming)
VTASIVLDEDAVSRARGQYALPTEPRELSHCAHVQEAIAGAVQRDNDWLARVGQIKADAVLPGFLARGGDKLTPTPNLKRRVIEQKYSRPVECGPSSIKTSCPSRRRAASSCSSQRRP